MPRTKEQFELLRKERRQKILDAALEVFAKDGYKSATVGSIAKTADISQGLLYNYFKSKEAVLRELILGMLDKLMCELDMVKPGKKITRKDMIDYINASIDMVLEKPQYWKLYFSIFLQPEVLVLLYDKLMELAKPYEETFVNYFKDRGVKDPVIMVRYFSAAIDGVQMHCMIEPENYPVTEIKELLIKQFVK